jgi:hypothetical protein
MNGGGFGRPGQVCEGSKQMIWGAVKKMNLIQPAWLGAVERPQALAGLLACVEMEEWNVTNR